MKFLLDMGVTPKAIPMFESFGHEAVRCADLGMARADDETIVEHAQRTGAVVVTTDKRFGDILILSGTSGPGTIILRLDNPTFSLMVSALRRVLETRTEREIWGSVTVVEHGKIRSHPLGD